MTDIPTIYVFSGMKDGSEGLCYALAQDGACLGSHWCSHECFAAHDLGVREGSRPDRHEHYRAHYPGGYRMEFVPAADIEGHAGLQAALEANRALSDAEPEGDAPDAAAAA